MLNERLNTHDRTMGIVPIELSEPPGEFFDSVFVLK